MNRKKITPQDFAPIFAIAEEYTGIKKPDPRQKVQSTEIALQNYYPFKKQVISFLVNLLADDLTRFMQSDRPSQSLNKIESLKKYLTDISDFKEADLVKVKSISKENKEKILLLRKYLQNIAFDLNEQKGGALLFNVIFGLSTNIYLMLLASEKDQNKALHPFFRHCEKATCSAE